MSRTKLSIMFSAFIAVAFSAVAPAAFGNIVQTFPANEYDFQGGCSRQGGDCAARSGWATFPSDGELSLVEVPRPSGGGSVQAKVVGTVPISPAFVAGSARVGIIAILIGQVVRQAPVLSFQDGGDIVVYVFDGSSLRQLAREYLPPGVSASTFTDILVSSYSFGASQEGAF